MVQMWYKTLCTFFILGRMSVLHLRLVEPVRLGVLASLVRMVKDSGVW